MSRTASILLTPLLSTVVASLLYTVCLYRAYGALDTLSPYIYYELLILSNCNTYKSPGPDCIHSYTLKAIWLLKYPLCYITHIFQQSLDSSIVPTQWKHAYVSPVFKIGSKTDPKKLLLYFTQISGLQVNGTHHCESNNETFRKP